MKIVLFYGQNQFLLFKFKKLNKKGIKYKLKTKPCLLVQKKDKDFFSTYLFYF